MKINWQEIQEAIEDELNVFTGLGDVAEMLQTKLGFSEVEALDMSLEMMNRACDAEDQIKLDLTIELCNYVHDCVRERDKKNYPEDNPDQILLFDPMQYDKE